MAPEQFGQRGGVPRLSDMHHIYVGHPLEALGTPVADPSVASRREIDLSRICLCVGDKLGNDRSGKEGCTSMTCRTR